MGLATKPLQDMNCTNANGFDITQKTNILLQLYYLRKNSAIYVTIFLQKSTKIIKSFLLPELKF